MKKIKVKFIGFWPGFDVNNNIFINTLKNKYVVEHSDDPEYLFYSVFGNVYDVYNYKCIRIFYSGENVCPDFNCADYVIGFDHIVYDDRFLRLPVYYLDKRAENLEGQIKQETNKDIFCNFIFSHQSANGFRERVFEELNKYKKVESCGSYLNNQEDGFIANSYEKKMNIVNRSKFTIAAESTDLNGFVTEKPMHALYGNSVPIYFGSKKVGSDFNHAAIIDYNDYNSFEDMIKDIISIDNDPERYEKMIDATKYAEVNQYQRKIHELEQFLYNIVDQEYSNAFRRPLYFHVVNREKREKLLYQFVEWKVEKRLSAPYLLIKKLFRLKDM